MAEEPTRGQSRPSDTDMSGLSGWITTDVAARAVRVSPRTIRRYIDRGELKAKVEGEGVERRWLIDVDSLHALRASRPESETVRGVSGETEGPDRLADVIRDLAARVEERTAEATEMRVRLQLSEQAQSTVEEEARRLREENEQLRQELEALREARESPETDSEDPYLTHAPPKPDYPVEHATPPLYDTSAEEAEESLQRRSERSWWRRFFGIE
jgi:regulator of replication initiation timing